MTEQVSPPNQDYELPEDIAAMIAAGNKARAEGIDPSVISEEHDDDKSYANRYPSPRTDEETVADSQATQDAVQIAKQMGERVVANPKVSRSELSSRGKLLADREPDIANDLTYHDPTHYIHTQQEKITGTRNIQQIKEDMARRRAERESGP